LQKKSPLPAKAKGLSTTAGSSVNLYPFLDTAEIVVDDGEQLRLYVDGLEEPCGHPTMPTDLAENQQEAANVARLVGP
jgi:hypothetical protein